MSGYIGNIPVPEATQTRDVFTATSGQTVFPTSGYSPGYLDVYLNGVHLDPSDYTATNGSDVVLNVGAAVNDELYVVNFNAFNIADTVSKSNGGTFDNNITVTGSVTATSFLGDGSSLTGIDALPSQTGQSGNYLTTDGSTASWAALDTDANTTTKGLYEMANTISANYSITSGNNAMSAGPISIDSGVSVTVPTGSTWTIV